MTNLVLVAAIYEGISITISCVLLALILKKYFERRHQLTKYLFIVFLNFSIAIFFAWLSKIVVLTTDLDYVYNNDDPKPNTLVYWMLYRIIDFRFNMVFIASGVVFSYIFKVKIFEKDYIKWQKIFVFTFGGYSILFSIFVYVRGNTLLDALTFLNVLILMWIVYLPFMMKAIKNYRSVDNPIFKKGFLALTFMCLFFMLILLFILLDRIVILLELSEGFSIFYFLAVSCVNLGFITTYFGYIKPRSSES